VPGFLGLSEGYWLRAQVLPRPRIARLAIAPQLQQIRPLASSSIASETGLALLAYLVEPAGMKKPKRPKSKAAQAGFEQLSTRATANPPFCKNRKLAPIWPYELLQGEQAAACAMVPAKSSTIAGLKGAPAKNRPRPSTWPRSGVQSRSTLLIDADSQRQRQ